MADGKILGLAHVGLFVTDVERSIEFYRDVLGFEVIWDATNDGVRMVFVQLGTVQVELVQVPNPQQRVAGWFDHLALKVDDLDKVKAALQAKGVEFDESSYVSSPAVFENGSRWIFFQGPDGERLELVQNF